MNMKLFSYIFSLLFITTLQQYDIDLDEFMDSPEYKDAMNCFNHEDLSTCSSVKMTSGLYQCCRVKMTMKYYNTYYGGYRTYDSSDLCSVWVSIDLTDDQIKSMQESYQEAATFMSLVYGSYIPELKYEFTCQKKSYTLSFGKGTFTDEEIEIMKDENYCLRLYYEGLHLLGYVSNIIGDSERTITKDICMNGKTLPKSQNSCAYASFKFTLDDGTKETISTCMLVSTASFETKNLDKLLEQDFAQFTDLKGQSIDSFEVEISNKDGNTLKYDSLTKTLTGNSKYLEKSLLLFSLLVFLF